jgi:undecaprenyl diphosphate synthase
MSDLFETLDPGRLPRHIAVIMDGNGRWAKLRHMPRIAGHKAGVDSVRDIVESCARLGIEALTLYAFSTENWRRPSMEVQALWQLLRLYLRSELSTLQQNNVRLTAIGRIDDLPASVRNELTHVTRATAANTGLHLNLALNYSGRTELVDAVRSIVNSGIPAEAIDEELVERHLYTAGLPEPDLLIRTSGEMRVSNFLLWQIAYSELVVSTTLWPDFRARHLVEAITEYQRRERRFGGVGEASPPASESEGVPVGVASR